MTTTFGPKMAWPFLSRFKDENFKDLIGSNQTSMRLELLTRELTKIFESEVIFNSSSCPLKWLLCIPTPHNP